MKTAMQELWEWIDANYHEDSFNLNDAKEISLQREQDTAIKFHRWMLKNDTEQNAEIYFHYSDNDMWNEFLK